ncbi:intracellular hyaluronan-binding protein 4-like isoform X2 [Halichoeres trimaculatus]|uniref:intracellular hyaluronan-binding protein 4-like isoform X2 n=1 Tax=Halichoeres trimaculatus TaxID=147232 RepID=UPI003D9EE36D
MLPDAYGCAVANRFGNLLDDDEDPFDLINKVETEKEKNKKKKDDDKKGRQNKPGQKESQKDRRVPKPLDAQAPVPARKQQQARPGSGGEDRVEAQRGAKRASFGDRRGNQVDYPQEFSVSQPSFKGDSDFRDRESFRGGRAPRGGGRYPRNPDNFNQRGKRAFDRHNGTGMSPEEKRGGRGPWNWGSVDEVGSEQMEVTSDALVKSGDSPTQGEEENQNQVMEEDGEMMVQVAVEMSLDEWKAMQEMSRPKAEFNIRQAEHEIPSKAKVIHKSKHLENVKESPEHMEEDGNFLRKSVNDITSLMDINFGSLGRPSRGGRGRGRGGQTSRPERPKSIPERAYDPAPNPDDPEDFPALSAGL